MSRIPRAISEGDIYHVYARGVGGQIIFEDDEDRKAFIACLIRAHRAIRVEVLAWCLMDNHVHLLLRGKLQMISGFMDYALGTYARSFNERTGRTGHLFQSRFGSEAIDTEEYLLQATRYIHQNPEKAKLARTDSYRWSSYREYVGSPVLTSTDTVLGLFGSKEAFVEFHKRPSDVELREYDDGKGEAGAKRAYQVAIDELGEKALRSIRVLPRAERDSCLVRLKSRGLTTRQIERFTGVSRSTVSRIAE